MGYGFNPNTMMQAARRRQSHTGVARMAEQVAQQLY